MSARRGKRPVEVLPPEAEAVRTGLAVRIDAAHLRVVALATRAAVAEVALPKVLQTLKKQAAQGSMEALVKMDRMEAWRAAITLEALEPELNRRGFLTRQTMHKEQSHYSESEIPALAVSWRAEAS